MGLNFGSYIEDASKYSYFIKTCFKHLDAAFVIVLIVPSVNINMFFLSLICYYGKFEQSWHSCHNYCFAMLSYTFSVLLDLI